MEKIGGDNHAKWFWGVFSLVAGVNAFWWFVLQLLPVRDTDWHFWFNAVYAVPFLLAGVLIAFSVWHWKGHEAVDKRALLFVALGIIAHGIAQLLWTYYNIILRIEAPSESTADIFYAASVLLQIAGFGSLLVHRIQGTVLSRGYSIIRFVGTLLLVFVLSVLAVRVAFPVGTGFILNFNTFLFAASLLRAFILALNIYRGIHTELRVFLFIQLLAACFIGGADALYAIQNSAGSYWNGNITDALYAAGALFAMCSVVAITKTLTHEDIAEGRHGYSHLQFLFPLSIVLVGMLLGGRAAELTYSATASNIADTTQRHGQNATALLDHVFHTPLNHLDALTALLETREVGSQEEFFGFVSELLGEELNNAFTMAFVDSNQIIRFSSIESFVGKPVSTPTLASLLARAQDSDTPVLSDPYALTIGVPGILAVRPVEKEGVLFGWAVISMRLPALMEHFLSVTDLRDYQAILVTGNYETYLDISGAALYDDHGNALSLSGIAENPPPLVIPDPEDMQTAATHLEELDLELWLRPFASGLAKPYEAAVSLFLIVSLVCAAIAGIVFMLTIQQVRLDEELHRKTSDLRQKISELARIKFFLDHVSEAVVAADADHAVLYANNAASVLAGESVEHLIGQHVWPQLFSRTQIDPSDVEMLLTKQGGWEGQIQAVVEGVTRDLLVTILPLREEGQEDGLLIVSRDISKWKEVERDKNRFVSLVSHQLRAPMVELRWMAEQLMTHPRLPTSVKEELASMERIIAAESQLVGDLLNVSRIERGVLKITLKDVSLRRLITDALKPLERLAAERHIALSFKKPPAASVKVHVDDEKIAEALRNIVDNALKYSPEYTEVVLSTEMGPDWVEVFVRDRGPGIPSELRAKIFEVKTSASSTGEASSAGLGLFLTKKFIEAVGGEIRFETSSEGTTFIVRLPKAGNSRYHGPDTV